MSCRSSHRRTGPPAPTLAAQAPWRRVAAWGLALLMVVTQIGLLQHVHAWEHALHESAPAHQTCSRSHRGMSPCQSAGATHQHADHELTSDARSPGEPTPAPSEQRDPTPDDCATCRVLASLATVTLDAGPHAIVERLSLPTHSPAFVAPFECPLDSSSARAPPLH